MPPPAVHSLVDRGLNVPGSTIQARDDKDRNETVRIVVYVLAALAGVLILGSMLRHFYLKNRRKHVYHPAGGDDDTAPSTRELNRQNQRTLDPSLSANQPQTLSADNTTTANGVDRTTSVRSVMTLPVYRPKPTENELVLGREGERDGIDIVVEMRTAEEEEALRDEEMEALYQIRAARRQQIAEREERRRARAEARENRDVVALQRLRETTRDRSALITAQIEELRSEHDRIRETRQRAVSSVSYADVGIARADGTRVRANSTESTERVGLLSDAASIGGGSLFERRDRSASAALSIDTSRSMLDRPDSPGLSVASGVYGLASGGRTRSRASSAATTTRFPTPSPGMTPHAGSPPEIIDAEDADLGDVSMPPPGYDEVSLDEFTPLHSRRNSDVSGRASPYPDPPPEYPGAGPAEERNRRLSARMEGLAAEAQTQGGDGTNAVPEGRNGHTTLPSLRVNQVPQIVIEPVSARPQ